MERLNRKLLEALQPAWRMALCGPDGCEGFVAPSVLVRQSHVKSLPLFLTHALWQALALALQYKPQVVVAGSGLTAPIAWLVARCCGAKAIVYLHGLDVIAPNFIYQALWLPFIRRCDLALVNSLNTAELAKGARIVPERLRVLNPGTDIPDLDAAAGTKFRRSNALGQRPVLLSVGRLTQRKGLAPFVRHAMPAILARHPDALLLIIGAEARQALHAQAGSQQERILAAAREVGVESSLRFLGNCDEDTLGAAYQAANVHVFPVLDQPGDVEGFGMVALEAAAHGLPTVAFNVGGVPDAVLDGQTGDLIGSGDYVSMSDAIARRLGQTHDPTTVVTCRNFAAGKSWSIFGERLRQMLTERMVD